MLPQRVRCDQLSAMLMQRSRVPEQARGNTPPKLKIHVTSKSPVGDISVVTLIRTDTTLDHSQKAEKVCTSPGKAQGRPGLADIMRVWRRYRCAAGRTCTSRSAACLSLCKLGRAIGLIGGYMGPTRLWVSYPTTWCCWISKILDRTDLETESRTLRLRMNGCAVEIAVGKAKHDRRRQTVAQLFRGQPPSDGNSLARTAHRATRHGLQAPESRTHWKTAMCAVASQHLQNGGRV